MLSISQLRKPAARQEVLDEWIDILQSLGFSTTGWQPGRVQRTFLTAAATIVADMSEVAKAIVEFGFNSFSSGVPLTEFARSRYENTRLPAVKTAGPMTLTSTALVPYDIEVGQLIVSNDSGKKFRNTTGGTLNAGGTLTLTFQATLAGQSHNVGSNTVTKILTPLAGVTVANSAPDPWYTTTGIDQETDAALKERNRTKWATQSLEMVADGYRNYALSVAGITKISIDDNNPRGENTIDVYVAAEFSLVGAAEKQALQEIFAKRVFGTSSTYEEPPTAGTTVAVLDPNTDELTLTGTVYHDPNVSEATVTDAVNEALEDFLTATPIGGYDFAPGPSNVITPGDILQVLEAVEGVRTVTLTTPTAPVSVGVRTLVTEQAGGWGLTYQAVTAA